MSTINNPKWIIPHQTGGTDLDALADTSHHTLEIIDAWHKKKGYPISDLGYYCGYHYVIERDGKIRQARGVHEAGFHCPGMNHKSIGICLAGNFDRPTNVENHKPTYEQIKGFETLSRELTATHDIALQRIVSHRKFAFGKTCPGKNLKDDWGYNICRQSIIKESIGIVNQLIMIFTKYGSLFLKVNSNSLK